METKETKDQEVTISITISNSATNKNIKTKTTTTDSAKALKLDQSIQKLNVLFKFSGMNVKKEIKSKTVGDFITNRWLYIINSICSMSAIIASFYYIIIGVSQGKDIVEVTSITPCITFSILGMFKSFFYFVNEEEVFKLIHGLRELEMKENEEEDSVEKAKIGVKDRNFLNAVINVLYFLNCSMIVVFDLTPLVLIAMKYIRTKELEMLLPYLDVFSFIPYRFEYWLISYVHQIWSECLVLLEVAAADYLFFTCCTYIKIQIKLLKYDFERIVSGPSNLEDVTGLEVRDKFVKLVRWHQDLIELSESMETIYCKSNLFNFLTSSLVICLTGFNVTIVDDVVVVVTFITFLFMSLMQVFFLCFFADMLMIASIEVSDAIYNCRWYCMDKNIAKDLHLVQTRAQKPCKLTASGYADVNLSSFMRVLSTSWSYFALLQTIYGNK